MPRKSRKSYFEKLSDRRWQDKVHAIKTRDKNKCQINESHTKEQLHVHHKYYRNGADPWDYPDDALITLCASCHWEHEQLIDEIKYMAGMGGKAFMEEVLRFMKATAENYKFGWIKEIPLSPEQEKKLRAEKTYRGWCEEAGTPFTQEAFEAHWERRTKPVSCTEATSAFAALRAQMGR